QRPALGRVRARRRKHVYLHAADSGRCNGSTLRIARARRRAVLISVGSSSMHSLPKVAAARRTDCPLDSGTLENILDGGLGARAPWLAVSDGYGQLYAERGEPGPDTPPIAVLPGLGKHRLPATLRSGGRSIGTLVLVRTERSTSFSSSDEKLLNAVGTLAGQAIANARLYEELHHHTEALRNGQAHLRAVLDNVAEGIVTSDAEGLIQSFNAAAERVFGYSAEEVIGQH